MGSHYGGIYPTQYLKTQVHPEKTPVHSTRERSAEAEAGQSSSTLVEGNERKVGSPSNKSTKRRTLTDHGESLSSAKNESFTKSATIADIVVKLTNGETQAGKQYKLTKTTPGSAGTNYTNPMTKRSPGSITSAIPHIKHSK